MSMTILRPLLRTVPRSTVASRLARQPARRGYAEPGDSSRPVPPNPAGGSSRLPFILVGSAIFIMVAGRYFADSSKSPRSGQIEQSAARQAGDTSNRDPRDSPIKTLKDKEQKEQGS